MPKRILTAVALIPLPLLAGECPPAPDHTAALEALVAKVQAATSERDARLVSNRMWELWADAPNEQAQAVLDRGMAKRASFDLLGAIADFDILIDYCPAYAEGYNQRAFAYFIQRDYPRALTDLHRALELSPDHIAARAGLALTLMQLGRIAEARTELETAVAQNPWLSERHLLARGGPLAPEGDDI